MREKIIDRGDVVGDDGAGLPSFGLLEIGSGAWRWRGVS